MKTLQALILMTLTLSPALAQATEDPYTLSGVYEKDCRSKPEEGCPYIDLSFGSDNQGNSRGEGNLSGGDTIEVYQVKQRVVQLKNGFIFELTVRPEFGKKRTMVFLPKAQKIIDIESGLVLEQSTSK